MPLKIAEFSDDTTKAFQAIACQNEHFFAKYKTIEGDMQTLQTALQVLKPSGKHYNQCWNWSDSITKSIEELDKTASNNSNAIRIHTRTLEILKRVNEGFGGELYSRRAENKFKSIAAKERFYELIDALIKIKDKLQKLKDQKSENADTFIKANGLTGEDAFLHGNKALEDAGITECEDFFNNMNYKEISKLHKKADESIKKLEEAKGEGQFIDNVASLTLLQGASELLKILDECYRALHFTNEKSSALEIVQNEITYQLLVRDTLAVKKELIDCDLVTGGIGRFEKINFYQELINKVTTDHFKIPLRAFCDLAEAMKNDSYISNKGSFSFVLHVLTQIAVRALKKGRVIFADATMPEELQWLIESCGGEVIRLNVSQNLRVVRVKGERYSLGIESKDRPRKFKMHTEDMLHYASILKKESKNNLPWAHLTHKGVWEEYARVKGIKAPDDDNIFNAPVLQEFFHKTGVRGGWFNRHDRGHNEFKFFNLAIFGQINLSPKSIATQYEAARAVMLACGNETWGAWDGSMTDISTGNCIPIDAYDQVDEDGQILQHASKAKLWYLKWIVANLVQAIGRSRAVISEVLIECYIFGGIILHEIDAMFEEYGIKIAETIENTVHRTRQKYNEERGAGKNTIDEIALNMQRNGEAVSIRSVKEMIESQGKKTSIKSVEARLKYLRDYKLLPASTKGGKATHKDYAEAKQEAKQAFERITLDTKQEDQFNKKILDQLFSAQCDLDNEDEMATIEMNDKEIQVYKVGFRLLPRIH